MENFKAAIFDNPSEIVIEKPPEKNSVETVEKRKDIAIPAGLVSPKKKIPARVISMIDVAPSPGQIPNGFDTLNDRESVFGQTMLDTLTKPVNLSRPCDELQKSETGVFACETENTSPLH